MRQSRVALLSFGLGFVEGSLQVATSPCCPRDLPDVISANPSSDAWSLATAVPRSASACFFLRVIGLPQQRCGSASRFYPRTRLFTERFSGLQTFLYVQASELAHLPGRSYRCALTAQGSRGFYVRAYRASLPPHAPDMLAARTQAIGGVGTFTRPDSQPCRLLPSVYASLGTSRCRSAKLEAEWIATPFS
jgi:hypothetical protein